MNNRTLIIIIGLLVLVSVSCIACLALTGIGAYFFAREVQESGGPDFETSFSTESVPKAEFVRPEDSVESGTLLTLENTIVPENDPVDLAERLLGIGDIPATVEPPAQPYEVGDSRSFWVTDTLTDTTFQTQATLRYVGDEIYFWVEQGVSYDENDLFALAHAFEDEVIPLNRAFFGMEWNPGIDGDPHIYILYTTRVGFSTAGYFSSADSLHPLAHEFSNAAEMFVLNADNSPLDDPFSYGVLAHEFQHMIHWYQDRNETSWLNEGLSELATLLNDYAHTGFGRLYTSNPDLQLNDWPADQDLTPPHYGAGFLFVTYFMEQFGNEATQALVADPANGLDSVDDVLEQSRALNPETGELLTADDVVMDWIIANYLLDESIDDGRYSYGEFNDLVNSPSPTEFISDCGPNERARDVRQYGVDYFEISCGGAATLHFEGSSQTRLLPESPYSGHFAFWSNKGDESDMTLTQAFDFSDVDGPISMSYMTWYDIEADWDYLYVLASTNGGETWDFLPAQSSTDTDPNGNSYGWAYTGFSGGGEDAGIWIDESVDLSAYAGQEILLRFEYITDAAVNGEGLLLDDVHIDALGYFTDFEADEGGWEPNGFARVQNVLPQTFRLALIVEGADTSVQMLEVPSDNALDISLDFDQTDSYTLVVMGSTRFTRQSAAYRIDFR